KAVEVLKTPPKHRNPEFAHIQLGEAHEKLAQFGDAYFDHFETALGEYKEAAALTKDRKSGSAKALVASGRCRFLEAKNKNSSESEREKRLAQAKQWLNEAINAARGTEEEARGRFWLAQLLAFERKIDDSDREFDAARRVANGSPELT